MRLVTPTSPDPANNARLPPSNFWRRAFAFNSVGPSGRVEPSGIRTFEISDMENQERLEQREMHNRKHGCAGGSRKIIERLLLNPDGEADGKGTGSRTSAISNAPAQRAHVRHQKLTLGIVIRVE